LCVAPVLDGLEGVSLGGGEGRECRRECRKGGLYQSFLAEVAVVDAEVVVEVEWMDAVSLLGGYFGVDMILAC
jgi:hypothetical protein